MPLSDLWESHVPPDDSDSSDIADDSAELNKRKLQTAKAREARAIKRALKEVQLEGSNSIETTYSQRLQTNFFTHQYQRGSYVKPGVSPTDAGDVKQQFSRERARCVWSFLQGLKAVVLELFRGKGDIQHVLNTCIADDTTTKLKSPTSSQSIVYTVMNTVQSAQIRFANKEWECLHVPTPIKVLTSGKASSIHRAFTSWLLVSASGAGEMWNKLGCPPTLLDKCVWKTTVLIGDALKANDAARRHESRKRLQAATQGSVGIRLRCCNHQLCLVRKPTVLSIERFWATIVRLGHLLEVHSFRRSLAAALVKLIQGNGQFIRIFKFVLVVRFLFLLKFVSDSHI